MEIGISWGLAWRGNHLHAGERSLLFSAVLHHAALSWVTQTDKI